MKSSTTAGTSGLVVPVPLVHRLLGRIRPTAAERAAGVAPAVLLGWYARKAALPAVRGLLRRSSLRSVRGLLLLGPGVRIAYPRMVSVGRHCAVGGSSSLMAYSQEGITLGDGVTIRENAWIQCSSSPGDPGVGLRVGRRTYIGPGAVIGVGGLVQIGEDCQLGAGCTLISENHAMRPDGSVDASKVRRLGIVIGDGCWLGHRSTILDGVELGAGCVVGAGAVVTRSFPAGTRLGGVPARPLHGDDGGC